MADQLAVPVPARMENLVRDRRGYPVPVIAFVDQDGRPHFTINDELRRQWVIEHDRCAICGHELEEVRYLVGGPASAFHARGAYMDTPLHWECAEYALKVCPYLAVPHYGKRIDAGTLPADNEDPILVDPTQDPTRPPLFVMVGCVAVRVTTSEMITGMVEYVKPMRPYVSVEYWRHGQRVAVEGGDAIVRSLGLDPMSVW